MAYIRAANSTYGLNPGDGMSVSQSTEHERSKVLELLLEEPSEDCIKFGFYMGKHYPGPIADYKNDCVKKEITLNDLKK